MPLLFSLMIGLWIETALGKSSHISSNNTWLAVLESLLLESYTSSYYPSLYVVRFASSFQVKLDLQDLGLLLLDALLEVLQVERILFELELGIGVRGHGSLVY